MMKEIGKRRAIFDYIPAIIGAILSIVTFILYATIMSEQKPSNFVAIGFIGLAQFALIFINRRWKIGIPFYLIALICLHMVLAVDLGTALGWYGKLFWWDLFVHGYFGFVGCAIFYYLYLRFEEKQPKLRHFVVFLLLTISFAALWEIYEYVAGLILHYDMQAVESAIAAGRSPLEDTMTDMMIAIAGALLFFVFLSLKQVMTRKLNRAKPSVKE